MEVDSIINDTIDQNSYSIFRLVKLYLSKAVADFLLNFKEVDKQQKLEFISDCSSASERFEKPSKRNKISNFVSQNIPKVLLTKDIN